MLEGGREREREKVGGEGVYRGERESLFTPARGARGRGRERMR